MLPVRSRRFNFFLLVERVLFLYPCHLPAQFIFSRELLGDESLEECPCIIFRNCFDIEDSVNSLTVALTNFSLSLVILALFSALNASTGSGKRMLKSFNLVTCQPNSIRKSSNDIPGSL